MVEDAEQSARAEAESRIQLRRADELDEHRGRRRYDGLSRVRPSIHRDPPEAEGEACIDALRRRDQRRFSEVDRVPDAAGFDRRFAVDCARDAEHLAHAEAEPIRHAHESAFVERGVLDHEIAPLLVERAVTDVPKAQALALHLQAAGAGPLGHDCRETSTASMISNASAGEAGPPRDRPGPVGCMGPDGEATCTPERIADGLDFRLIRHPKKLIRIGLLPG